MKRGVFVILFLIVAFPALADPLDYETLNLNLDLSNIIEVTPTSSSYRIDYVTASLTWVPRESYRQTVSGILTEPDSEWKDDELDFRWSLPKEKELWIKLSSGLETNANYFQVKKKVKFPIKELDPSFSQYLIERNIIDFNNDIEETAALLAEGKDDLYDVVFTIATWVNENINYSLDTITAEASQKSSWVLQKRRGVCDELTSLFISMLRTLGIPARFVYGESYTNIAAFEDNWGGHGWAEVYFPDLGWIPFDPTYGEYGYVDAGHVKMGNSLDSRRPSLKYAMKAKGANVNSGFLDIDIDVIRQGKKLDPEISLQTDLYYSETGFNSYNMITATVRNDDDYYKPVSLQLVKPKEIEILNGKQRNILLKPNEEKKVHWIVKISKKLEKGFTYTFPFSVVSDRNLKISSDFKAHEKLEDYSKEVFESIIETDIEEEGKEYSKFVNFYCDPSQEHTYSNELIMVNCILINRGNKFMSNVKMCHEEICERKNLEINGEVTFSFTKEFSSPGTKNIIVTAENSEFKRTTYPKVSVIDETSLNVIIDTTDEIKYGETANIVFTIEKTSLSLPKKVDVSLEFQGASHKWYIENLEKPSKFEVSVDSKGFTFNNEFLVIIEYEDELGKKYKIEKEIKIKLTNLGIKGLILVSLNSVGYTILSWFT